MIVTVTAPANAKSLKYGGATILLDENHQADLPAYIAKAMIALPGVTCQANLSASYSALLNSADTVEEQCEPNYIFYAYGMTPPEEDRLAAAGTLLADKGLPAVTIE